VKSAKYKIEIAWTNGTKEEFDVMNYEIHDTLITLTRQIENQTSSFLAALTSEEKIGIPLANILYYKLKG